MIKISNLFLARIFHNVYQLPAILSQVNFLQNVLKHLIAWIEHSHTNVEEGAGGIYLQINYVELFFVLKKKVVSFEETGI